MLGSMRKRNRFAGGAPRCMFRTMSFIRVEIPAELLELAAGADAQPSRAATKLLALELFRENRVSIGKTAELAGMVLEDFMEFSAQREVPLPYGQAEWEHDHEAARDFGR